MGKMSECIFKVQPTTQPLIYFCHGVAAWAGTGLFECLKDASKT